jgi:tetratricopeptide (TPR) repeat protein
VILVRKSFLWLPVLALVLAAGGCTPSATDPLDEQREPHFLTGKSRVNAMDYEGAVEAFEKSLEVNPRSSSAHFELGLLYEDKVQDYAAAIYHFDRYLKLRPTSDYAEIVRQRIVACKQELAKTVSLVPVQQTVQRDLERQADEIRDLRQKLEAWQAYFAARGETPPAATNPPAATAVPARPGRAAVNPAPSAAAGPPPEPAPSRPARTTKTIGTYSVKGGDTPASIARKYGVKLDALVAANPGVDPKRLKIGQSLNIPAP